MKHPKKIKVGISIGDLNGIGSEIVLKTFDDSRMLDFCTPVIFASTKIITFLKKKYNPYDIKPIIHPVDFVIFNGDHDKQVNEVVFLSKKSKNPNLAALQKSVGECVEKKNYDFKMAKISNEGKVTFV